MTTIELPPTDKISHGYAPTYEALAHRYGPHTTLAEIGVGNGAGLLYFRRLFGPGARIVGVDHHMGWIEEARRFGFSAILMDQEDPGLPDQLRLYAPELQLIVDDASHAYEATIATYDHLWPLVAPGGTYVVEDWSHLSYGPRFAEWAEGLIPTPRHGVADVHEVRIIPEGLIVITKTGALA